MVIRERGKCGVGSVKLKVWSPFFPPLSVGFGFLLSHILIDLDSGDPGKPSSTRAASDAVPSPPLDAMAGLSEEVAQPEQEQMHLYLHDDFPVQDLEGD